MQRRCPLSSAFSRLTACKVVPLPAKKSMIRALGLLRQFRELLPVIWMKAGAIGPCPSLNTDQLPTMMILSENKFAVLLDENYFSEFEENVNQDSKSRLP